MTRCLLTALIAVTAFAPGVRADEGLSQPTPGSPSASAPLRFSLNPQHPASPRLSKAVELGAVDVAKAVAALERQRNAAMESGNCGMPVIPASPGLDRRILHEPRPGVRFSIQHIPPRTCGR
jgi:hypothetical protein